MFSCIGSDSHHISTRVFIVRHTSSYSYRVQRYIHVTPKKILSSDFVSAHVNNEHEHAKNTRFATYVPIKMGYPFVDKLRPNFIFPYVHWKVVVIRFSPEVESNFFTNRNWGTCLLMSLVLLSCDKQPMPLPFQTSPTFASPTSLVKSCANDDCCSAIDKL